MTGPVHIPGYEGFEEIGRGGFAVVYRARQVRLHRTVAVKVLTGASTDPVALARFERECAAVGSLSGHPHVVAVHDAGTTEDGRPYLVMEHLPAGTLADRLRAGPLPVAEALRLTGHLADALDAAHRAGVLHRDVKPENVLQDAAGTPKLADFGIATVADAHQTSTGEVVCTVVHAAPEVLSGERAAAGSDVYSLASTLFALLTGRPAFAGEHDEGVAPVLHRALTAPVPDLRARGLPPEVAGLVETGMAKDPAHRFRSARALSAAVAWTLPRLGP